MRVTFLSLGALGVLGFVGCATTVVIQDQTPGAGGASSSTSSTGSSSSTTSSGSSGVSSSGSSGVSSSGSSGVSSSGSSGTGGGPTVTPVCAGIPGMAPSHGSCVPFMWDAGVALDAGNATQNTCNPLTNEGCTGTDICGPDGSETYWVCQPGGAMPNIPVCGDCTNTATSCKAGGLCIGETTTSFQCWQMCCSDADCGGVAGSCNTMLLQPPLPNDIGICYQ